MCAWTVELSRAGNWHALTYVATVSWLPDTSSPFPSWPRLTIQATGEVNRSLWKPGASNKSCPQEKYASPSPAINSAYDFRPPLAQIMSLSYSALPGSQPHLHPGWGGRGPPGRTDIFREPLFLLLRPSPSQVPPKGLNATCTAYFPFHSLVGNTPDSHFFFHFWQFHVACWILVPQQGLNPSPLHWKHQALITGPPGKSLLDFCF